MLLLRQLRPDGGILRFQEFSQGHGALGVAGQRKLDRRASGHPAFVAHDGTGKIAERAAHGLKMFGEVLVVEKLHDGFGHAEEITT